jgi:uncharacterized protein YhaN
MRFERINLWQYGNFSKLSIELPARNPDFYVIYGDNEAGKSTVLRAVSALLFGVPSRTTDAHTFPTSALRVGARIRSDSAYLDFIRRKGNRDTLLTMTETPLSNETLKPYLKEMDEQRFEQFFGLSHEGLRKGGQELLSGKGDVGSSLFQAEGLLSLRKILEGLKEEADALFSPSAAAKKKHINACLDQYKHAQSTGREAMISPETVQKLNQEYENSQQKFNAQQQESRELETSLIRLRRIKSNKPDLARLETVRMELASLNSLPSLPLDARAVRDASRAAISSITAQLKRLRAQLSEREEQIRLLSLDPEVKAQRALIEELNQGTSQYRKSLSDREKREREAKQAIETAEREWQQFWPGQSVSDAEALRPLYGRKASIQKTIMEHARIVAEHASATADLAQAMEDQKKFEKQLASQPQSPDTSSLLAAIEEGRRLGEIEKQVIKLKADIDWLREDAEKELKKLSAWAKDVEELERIGSPLTTTIELYSQEWGQFENSRETIHLRLDQAREAVARIEGESSRLRLQNKVASQGDLEEARKHRDTLWQLVRAFSFDGRLTKEDAQRDSQLLVPLPEGLSEAIAKADEIADLRFANASAVVAQERAAAELALQELAQTGCESELATLEEQFRQFEIRWSSEWREMAKPPLSPREMQDWIRLRDAVLDRVAKRRKCQADLNQTFQQIALAREQVSARMVEIGIPPVKHDETFAVLLTRADQAAKTIAQAKQSRDLLLKQIEGGLTLRKRLEEKVSQCNKRLEDWSVTWIPVIEGLALPTATSPDEVSDALTALEDVFFNLNDATDKQHRVETMTSDIETFTSGVSRLVISIDSTLANTTPDMAIAKLHARLSEADKAGTKRAELENENKRDAASIDALELKLEDEEVRLQRLRELAACENEERLEEVIAASEHKNEAKRESARLADGLVARNAATSIEEIEREAAVFDPDSLHAEIERMERKQTELRDEIPQTAHRIGELVKELERFDNSDLVAASAQQAEEALSEARTGVRDYLRLRLAAVVLERAIESYREKHQGPIVKRASVIFARLTRREHSGLTTEYTDNDRLALVSVRSDGSHVSVEGLSDGTRDQLYLSLRLAAIEQHIDNVGPTPVIFDDVLINSDDSRAAAALEILSELAARTQVLFFTHHSRLRDMAGTTACVINLDTTLQL